ncbi:class I SAM-dependent methyltransferase [Candidatus Saganbacteria bacterium]|nr:class I SAM-dependent methyltransferase [Candidatus Saganbacteria bacterium]
MADIKKQADYYENLLSTYGDHFLSLDWKSPESQGIRFNVFADLINMFVPDSFSVLDVGCGFGDLYDFLRKQNYKYSYTGFDIAPKIIDMARKKYPQAKFDVCDILQTKNIEKRDFIFLCGALNICFTDRDIHMEYIKSMLIRMFELCKIAVGVNFLSSKALYYVKDEDLNQKQYFYSKPEEITAMAKGLCDRFVIRHDYHPGDFTVYLIK